MKRLLIILLLTAFALSLVTVADAVEMPFIDVQSNAWYAEAVSYVYSEKMMFGVDDNHFAPEESLTRAMVVTPLWRREGSKIVDNKYAQPFADVAGAWYTDPITWAISEEIVKGYPIQFTGEPTGVFYYFAPDKDVSREELATLLYRYATAIGMDTSAQTDLSRFADHEAVSDWAKNALQWCVAFGIVDGMPENGTLILNPQGTATRAQFAAMLMRFDNLPLVIDAYSGEWKTTTGEVLTHAIPRITLAGAEIDALNKEIYQKLYTDKLGENGVPYGMKTDYEWYANGDILSLIIREEFEEEFFDYTVYSISISKAHVMTSVEVLEEAGLASAEFEKQASAALGNAYCIWLEDYIAKQLDSDEGILTQFKKTISKENAANAVPFFDKNGTLCICGNIYQLAGADFHEEILLLTGYKVSEYYDILLNKAG